MSYFLIIDNLIYKILIFNSKPFDLALNLRDDLVKSMYFKMIKNNGFKIGLSSGDKVKKIQMKFICIF